MTFYRLVVFVIVLMSCLNSFSQELRKKDFEKVILPTLEQGKGAEIQLARYCVKYPKNEKARLKLQEVQEDFLKSKYDKYMDGLLESYYNSNFNSNILISYWEGSPSFSQMVEFSDAYIKIFGTETELKLKPCDALPFVEYRRNSLNASYCKALSKLFKEQRAELRHFAEEFRDSLSDFILGVKVEDSPININECISKLGLENDQVLSELKSVHLNLRKYNLIKDKKITAYYSIPNQAAYSEYLVSLILANIRIYKEGDRFTSNIDSLTKVVLNEENLPKEIKELSHLAKVLMEMSSKEVIKSRSFFLAYCFGKGSDDWAKNTSNRISSQIKKLLDEADIAARMKVVDLIFEAERIEKEKRWWAENSIQIITPSGEKINVCYKANAFDEVMKWRFGENSTYENEGGAKMISIDDYARGVMTYLNREKFGEAKYGFQGGVPEYESMSGNHTLYIGTEPDFDWTTVSLPRKTIENKGKIIVAGGFIDSSLGKDFMASYILQMDSINKTLDWVKFFDLKEENLLHTYPQQLLLDNDNHLHLILSVYDICPDFRSACYNNPNNLGRFKELNTKWFRLPLHIPEYGFEEVYENQEVFNFNDKSGIQNAEFIWSFGYQQGYLLYGLNWHHQPTFLSLHFGQGKRELTKPGASSKERSDFILDKTMKSDNGHLMLFGRYSRFHFNCGELYITFETKSQDFDNSLNYFVITADPNSGKFSFTPIDSFVGASKVDLTYSLFENGTKCLLPDGTTMPIPINLDCEIQSLSGLGDNIELFELYSEFERK